MHCAKRGMPPPPPPPSEKYKIILDPNDYYQSDEPHTDAPPFEEHITEPSIHVVSTIPISFYERKSCVLAL